MLRRPSGVTESLFCGGQKGVCVCVCKQPSSGGGGGGSEDGIVIKNVHITFIVHNQKLTGRGRGAMWGPWCEWGIMPPIVTPLRRPRLVYQRSGYVLS